jgi:hypothetical protein
MVPSLDSIPAGSLKGASLSPPDPAQRRALLIGISKYPDSTDNLPGPPADLRQMRDLLIDTYGFRSTDIETLVDEGATRDAIIGAFARLRAPGPAGSVVVYYSGHGVSLTRNLSVQDTEESGVDQGLLVWGANKRATVLLDDELGVLIRSLRAGRVVLMLDACFSGSGAKLFVITPSDTATRRRARFVVKSVSYSKREGMVLPASFLSDGQTVAQAASEPVPHVLLGASDDTQRAYAGTNWPTLGEAHGIFTYSLVPLLHAPGALETPRQLLEKLRAATLSAEPCRLDYQCQRPQITGTQADIPLAVLLGAPAMDGLNHSPSRTGTRARMARVAPVRFE